MSQEGSLSRRKLLQLGCAAVASAHGCAGPIRSAPNPNYLSVPQSPEGGRVALSAFESRDMRSVCEHLLPGVTDMSWLSRGDSVFIKVACNSPYPHPAVTSPKAVEALVGYLKDRGAGTVYVGDQAGAEHVRLTSQGRVSSTREAMAKNGLLEAVSRSKAELHCFDDQGWDGYFQPKADFTTLWGKAIWLPKILEKVDHVLYLPRLGTHAVAGYTCGTKNGVGWLRDDSRRSLHQQGGQFFERIAEISHYPAIRNKLRFCLTMADRALLNIGPDLGDAMDLSSCVAIASQRLVDHDAMASALLPYFDNHHASVFDIYSPFPSHVNFWNKRFVAETWGEQTAQGYQDIAPASTDHGLAFDPTISHLAFLQNYHPRKIVVDTNKTLLSEDLLSHLRTFGDGVFAV